MMKTKLVHAIFALFALFTLDACGKLEEKITYLNEKAPEGIQSVVELPSMTSGAQISSASQVMMRARVGRPLSGTTASAASVMVKTGLNKGQLDETVK